MTGTPWTPPELAILARIAPRRVTGAELVELFPHRSLNSSRSALDAYRKSAGINAPGGTVWSESSRAALAMTAAAREAARVTPDKPRGLTAEQIAWAEDHAPAEDEQAILILAHLGYDMRLPGKPPSTEMRV